MLGYWKVSRCFARMPIVAAGACLVLGAVFSSPVRAQTPGDVYAVSGTAGFETGLKKLAIINPPVVRTPGTGVNVNWGDGTASEGLFQHVNGDSYDSVYGTHLYTAPGSYLITVSYDWQSVSYSFPFCIFGCYTSHFDTEYYTTATISPPGKFVILSIGDSIASGEGNPNVRHLSGTGGNTHPDWSFWDDAYSDYDVYFSFPSDEAQEWPGQAFPCHRSGWAGPSQAAAELEADNLSSDITFIHYACSGATIEPDDTEASAASGGWAQDAVGQLKIARERLAQYGAGIDVLLISAGSNSMWGPNSFKNGFGGLVSYCLKHPSECLPTQPPGPVQRDLTQSFSNLPSYYKNLAMEINCQQPPPHDGVVDTNGAVGTIQDPDPGCTNPEKQIPKLVLITEYMDPTHLADGTFPAPKTQCGPAFLKATTANFQFFYNYVVVPLNGAVDNFPVDAQQAGLNVPTYAVNTIAADFLYHGVCAGFRSRDRWTNNGNDSLYLLGEGPQKNAYPGEYDPDLLTWLGLQNHTEHLNGMLHPNSAVLAATLGNLQTSKPTCPPKCGQEDYAFRIYQAVNLYNPPATTIDATAGGSAYVFGTSTNRPVTITMSAFNAIQQAGLKHIYYAVDNPNCNFAAVSDTPDSPLNCSIYQVPFTISASGKHTVTFFSVNSTLHPETLRTAQVWIGQNAGSGHRHGDSDDFERSDDDIWNHPGISDDFDRSKDDRGRARREEGHSRRNSNVGH